MRRHLETKMKKIPTLFTPKLLVLSIGTRVLKIFFIMIAYIDYPSACDYIETLSRGDAST